MRGTAAVEFGTYIGFNVAYTDGSFEGISLLILFWYGIMKGRRVLIFFLELFSLFTSSLNAEGDFFNA